MEVTTIRIFNKSYLINNPGSGRVGSKLSMGIPYEKDLLVDTYQHKLTGTAFDVGAHIGNHALFFAGVCGLKVHAWEPHEKSLSMLEDNLALNPDLDITVHSWGAGNTHTRGRFISSMQIGLDPDRDGDKMKLEQGHVEVRPIDSIGIIDDLALVKIDVEGMEVQVLEGMVENLTANKPVIYTEAHTDEDWQNIGNVLTPLGYSMTRAIHMGSRQLRWNHPKGPNK